MKTFNVTIPIAGHAYMLVEAENEEQAIENAMNSVTHDDIEGWECLDQFNKGNVCFCPHPWSVEVELESEE